MGKAWTDDEIKTLKQMRLFGHSNPAIAKTLGRSIKSVETKLYGNRKGRTCTDCGIAILNKSTTGLCKSCYMVRHNADPVIRARIEAGVAANPDMAKGGVARRIAGRKSSKTRWSNPEYRARMTQTFIEKVRPRGHAPDVLARRDHAAMGRKISEARMAWCPEEYREDYRKLLHKLLGPGEARRIILEQIAKDKARELASLSPFERQSRALERGATLVANDLKPSLANPGIYEERKAG